MADHVGQVRWVYSMLATQIVDTPEATLVGCVGGWGKTSPFTTASYLDFGDSHCHPSCLGNGTLRVIDESIAAGGANDLMKYYRTAWTLCTNRVLDPFWRDCANSSYLRSFIIC